MWPRLASVAWTFNVFYYFHKISLDSTRFRDGECNHIHVYILLVFVTIQESSDLVRLSTVDDGRLEDVKGSVVLSPSWSSGYTELDWVEAILFAESEPPSA